MPSMSKQSRNLKKSNEALVAQWVVAAQSGDWAALEALYEYFFEPLYRFCYWQCQDEATAEDLTSETMMEMVKSIQRYSNKGSFKNWLYTIAKRKVFRWIRQHKYCEVKVDFSAWEFPDSICLIDPENEAKKAKYLDTLLSVLPDLQKTILELRYLDKLSVKEVAKQLSLSENQVKVYALRAKKKVIANQEKKV